MLRKAFLILSLLASFATASAQDFIEDDGFFIRKGYTWSPGAENHYTVTIIDPITNEEIQRHHINTDLPDTINGNHVYTLRELPRNVPTAAGTQQVRTYLFTSLQPHLKQLWFSGKTPVQSVSVHLRNVIADENGEIVFFEFSDVTGRGRDGRLRNLEYSRLLALAGGIVAGAPKMEPTILNGRPVMAYTDLNLTNTEITFDGSNFHFRDVAVKKEK